MGDRTSVKILHLTDLHISEDFYANPVSKAKLPHRRGHDLEAFLALNSAINRLIDWDVLVITGDITRTGQFNSFRFAKKWIESSFKIPTNDELGLKLNEIGKPYIVVPGNHDRFNGNFTQESLENYHKFFPSISRDSKVSLVLKGQTFNFHLFDSSTSDKSWGLGKIDENDLVPKILTDDSVDIAVLHHHLFKGLSNRKEYGKHITNSSQVIPYFLGSKFNAILFGHTHEYFADLIYPGLVKKKIKDKKSLDRFIHSKIPVYLLRSLLSYEGLSFTREKTKNGQFPKFSAYYEYLYIKEKLDKNIKGPSFFYSVAQFYRELTNYVNLFSEELKIVKRTPIFISMAPSGCQYESKVFGFNLIEFIFTDGKNTEIALSPYTYNGNMYALNGRIQRFKLNQ